MPSSTADNIHQLSLPLKDAQLLAELRFQQGRFSRLDHLSTDWLAASAVSANRQAVTLLTSNEFDGQAFDYASARHAAKDLSLASLTASRIQHLHQQLHPRGGRWRRLKLSLKSRHQALLEIHIDRPAEAVEEHIEKLIERLQLQINEGVEPLVAIPLFIYELFICFPFLNGNRRIALLLLTVLMVEHGHPIFQYVDIETDMLEHSQAFYQQLYHCSTGQHPIEAWLQFCWQSFRSLYGRFDSLQRHHPVRPGRGSKTQLIEQDILNRQQPFSLTELCQRYPTISRDMIRTILRNCRDRGWLTLTGRGRNAQWVISAQAP